MEEETDKSPFTCLPSEIIWYILQNNDYRDVVNLGLTCKHFNSLINDNQYLWKAKLKDFLPNDVFNAVDVNNDGNWFELFKKFYNHRKQIYNEIAGMSTKFYERADTIKLEDVRMFFSMALKDDLSYYYVIYVLQDLVRKANKSTQNKNCVKPYTLTEAFYAKIVLRFLVQTYLGVKWVEAHLKNELYPEVVLNFFIQWMDPLCFHLDKDVEIEINHLVDKVHQLLPNTGVENSSTPRSIPERIHNRLLTEKQVLQAISQMLYKQMRIAVMSQANLDNLDTVKAVKNKCGNPIVLAVIYHAVARKCGVHCEIIAFPHHLILQWRSKGDRDRPLQYKIALDTGELTPKGQCPFSNNTNRDSYKYCPDSLLQYIISAYLMSQGLVKDWYTQNSSHLLDFISTNPNMENPYRNFLPYLLSNTQMAALNDPIQIETMTDSHKQIILALAWLNPTPPSISRDVLPRTRNGDLNFAVGMICYHKRYDYLCVIRGWDLWGTDSKRPGDVSFLQFGYEQPFYDVIAVDQSSRYIAQENLTYLARPKRVYHVEDIIAKDFTHFDGFCYVPNTEKEKEYPEDGPIREFFRTRVQLLT